MYEGKTLLAVLLLFTAFIGHGCIEDVDIDRAFDRKVVVNCILSKDSVQTLTLSYNMPVDSLYYEYVDQAEVELYCDGEQVGRFQKERLGRWTLPYVPEEQSLYTLKVRVPGSPEITAETVFPSAPPIRKGIEYIVVDGSEPPSSYAFFNAGQAATDAPYWAFVMATSDSVMYSPRIVSSARKAEWIGVNCSVADDFNSLNRIYEGYSTQACYQYARFAPKKELGSVSIKIESPYLFFPELPAFGPKMPCSIIVFRGVSAEYDRYWKTSLQKMMTYMDEEDPTQWLDDSSIYSNIENGLGIFGAYNDTIFTHVSFLYFDGQENGRYGYNESTGQWFWAK